MLPDFPGEGQTPQAAYTRVLVVGATGRRVQIVLLPSCRRCVTLLLTLLPVRRVGRVLVRKLLLRGYAVSALVRSLEGHNLPQSVKLVQGNVSDYASCRAALEGIDKVRASLTQATMHRSARNTLYC